MEFVRTGIDGVDGLFSKNGYPSGNSILVLGGPGSGKSIYGMQYLYKGATVYDEPGIYVTLEETPQKIERNMAEFGWDISRLTEEGKILIIDATTPRIQEADSDVVRSGLGMDNLIRNLKDLIEKSGAKRVVIDSLSLMAMQSSDDFDMRTKLIKLSVSLSELDVTTIVLSEASTNEIGTTVFPPETFLFDGVIWMMLDTNSQERRLAIRKMRGTKHVLGSYRFTIDDEGIKMKA
ncbi:circadian clock protein kinase KaiC [archaeon BMS3Abin16]|nr:circadian clock protein kinase KaiC [archaeon BMS3Abin16]